MTERALARELVERLPLICVKPEVVNGALTSRELWFRDSSGLRWVDRQMMTDAEDYEWLPDLSDPATCGVLMGMLMERTRRITAWVNCERGTALLDVNMEDGERAPTLGEALALALLEMKETTDDQ